MKIMTTTENKKPISFEKKNIENVYIGKPNMCMCGCSGEYYKIGTKEFEIVWELFEEWNGDIDNIDDYIFTIETQNLQYTIYLKKEVKNGE